MKIQSILRSMTIGIVGAAISFPAVADDTPAPAKKETKSGQEDAQMMAMMMELAKPAENHKLLAHSVGSWTLKVKMWMNGDTNAPPMESPATATVKEIMGGRFFASETTGKMQMPGPDGKMMDMEFKGMGLEGYDNVKKKFISSWVDNMGTGIMMSEGTYDAATKTFTFHSEVEAMPGMKMKVREVVKIVDHDHHTFDWYEDRGTGEMKTMQIDYTRKK